MSTGAYLSYADTFRALHPRWTERHVPNMRMNWARLLSKKRVTHRAEIVDATDEEARTAFERDWDRIIFSTAFRRLHDKTQVFPLPDDDVVHSRLTHSLEVSSVGRSLGTLIGQGICKNSTHVPVNCHDIGAIVAGACLAHDIGNPPFGHAGEDAIGAFFRKEETLASLSGLTEQQRSDLTAFEGNAQGFRILTRLQHESGGGFQLTAAMLGAFCKYPRISGKQLYDFRNVATKKHGCFQQEQNILEAVADEVGLLPGESQGAWSRHPLAFLVEAADDICNSILDIEDGARLGHVDRNEAERLLLDILQNSPFQPKRLNELEKSKRLEYLRALSIGHMIQECNKVFFENEEKILQGQFYSSLAKSIPSASKLKALTNLARQHCYQDPGVLEIELAGYEALGGLLSYFVPTLYNEQREANRSTRAKELLRQRGVSLAGDSIYEKILRITDYVSGMTDRHALNTYRRLRGISLPGAH